MPEKIDFGVARFLVADKNLLSAKLVREILVMLGAQIIGIEKTTDRAVQIL